MHYSNTMKNRLFELTLHLYIHNPLFLDNDYGTIILQASFKLVLPNIPLNMNMLKIISH
jgi:hypothetical protein